jgi:hypothetical protein
MSEWTPIATAAPDGTYVDLWIEADGTRFRVTDYRWTGSQWEHKHGGTVEHNYYNVGIRITHWMAVPAPPDTTSVRSEELQKALDDNRHLQTALSRCADVLMAFDGGNPADETGWKHNELREAWVVANEALSASLLTS